MRIWIRRLCVCVCLAAMAPGASANLLLDLITGAQMGVDWFTSNTSRAVINAANELNLRNGYVEVESQVFDFSDAESVDLNFDVAVPFNILGLIGSAPNPGEDLRVDFLRDDGVWEPLTTFVADTGFLGILSLGGVYSYSGTLPTSAHHENFQIRYVMEGGGVSLFDLLGDNWYISNIEIDADVPPSEPDHFRFSFASSALTCTPSSVTIQACADPLCASLFADSVDVTLAPSGWVGGNTFTFTEAVTRSLAVTTPGTVTLGVSSASPAATNPTLCVIDGGLATTNCALTFDSAGFIVDAPDLIAGKALTGGLIRAVRQSDSSSDCVPAFANVSRNVGFWTSYVAPATGSRNALLGGANVSQSSAAPTSISLNFDGSGQAALPALNYSDAGQVRLQARFDGSGAEAGLTLTGSDDFIARPAGLCVQTASPCSFPYDSCDPFVAAGQPFSLQVTAMAWENDSDLDFCSGNLATPNYIANGVSLSQQRLSPVAGVAGVVSPSSVDISGGTVDVSATESEVGVFEFNATPPLYFGAALGSTASTTLTTYASNPTGRFVPAYLEAAVVDAGTLSGACPTGNTYFGEGFFWGVPSALSVTAFNLNGDITQNYTQPESLRLSASAVHNAITLTMEDQGSSANDGGALQLAPAPATALNTGTLSVNAPGQLRYELSAGDDFAYQRQSTYEVAPIEPSLQWQLANGVGGLADDDNVGLNAPLSWSPSGSPVSVRYGRLRLLDTYGAETTGLTMPLVAEYFDGSTYQVNTLDSCTVWDSANATVSLPSAAGTRSGTLASGSSGNEGIELLAPDVVPGTPDTGDATVTYDAPPWLEWDWDTDNSDDEPEATATFGINRGHERVIYRKETR